jgi:ribosome recycling factor
MTPNDQPTPDQIEKRKRLALRSLVDEMLAQIRATSSSESWTPDDRRRAEEDLERIMNQVRTEAMREATTEKKS